MQTNQIFLETWTRLLAPVRHWREDPIKAQIDPMRSPFTQDWDRILFSNAFRTLARKTQVHPFASNDHVHHRQMHSLEVASVGRSLGMMVGCLIRDRNELPERFHPEHVGQIVQAACLAHDIGNPPFGHGGETALQDWFCDSTNHEHYLSQLTPRQLADFRTFDGNAQGFRVVSALENHKDHGGLRLAYPTLAAFVKYPRSAYDAIGSGSKKFNFYQSEAQTFERIFDILGLHKGNEYHRHPLSYLTEAADDICYRIVDLEDAIELGIISYDDLYKVIEPIRSRMGLDNERMLKMDSDRRRAGLLRSRIITVMIEGVFQAFKDNYEAIVSGEDIHYLIDFTDSDIRQYMENATKLFYDVILKSHSKIAFEIGSYTLYKRILDTFVPACFHAKTGKTLSFRDVQALTLMGTDAPSPDDDLYMAYIRVMDFITGMTDPSATALSRQLAGIV